MDLNDTPEQAEYRAKVRAWLREHRDEAPVLRGEDAIQDEDDAVFQGNDTNFGLAAAVWTRDAGRAHRVARALKAGRVWINTYAEADPVMSMGGYKESGWGREYGAESIDAYTQTKSVLMKV